MLLRGSFFSRTLGMETGLSVLVPGGFTSDEPYKVVHLLHGLCGNHTNWTDYTQLPLYADDFRAVFVMPEVGRSFYTDMVHGGDYFTYVADELPEVTRRVFNLGRSREDTLVIGGSMGGYGALKAAFSRPDRFGTCAALAPSCLFLGQWMQNPALQDGTEPPDFPHIFGEGYPYDPAQDVVALAEGLAREKRPRLYLGCGESDGFYPDCLRFGEVLDAMGYTHTFRALPGGHDWYYFDTALREALIWCFSGPY